MDHSAIPRARAHSELGHLLDQENVAPAPGDCARHSATHYTSADDHNICAIHADRILEAGGRRLGIREMKNGPGSSATKKVWAPHSCGFCKGGGFQINSKPSILFSALLESKAPPFEKPQRVGHPPKQYAASVCSLF
jgi:hypothetical protein